MMQKKITDAQSKNAPLTAARLLPQAPSKEFSAS